jgi:hypothetical protein
MGDVDMLSIRRGVAAMLLVVPLAACSGDAWITGGELIRPGEPTGTITVVNATSRYFDAVMISDCTVSTYGVDRLPDGVSIGPGQSYSFTVSAGCWDVNAFSSGSGTDYGEARQRMTVRGGGIVEYTVNG